MVGHCQLIVQVGDVFTDLRADDLLFNGNGLDHEVLSPGKLLLLTQLDGDPLHRASFLLLCCMCIHTSSRVQTGRSALSILDNRGALRLDREGLGKFRVDRHATAVYTLSVLSTVHLLEALVEDCLSLLSLITLFVRLSQGNFQLKHPIVVSLQYLRRQFISLFERIKGLIVLSLVRKDARRLLVKGHQDFLVRDLILGKL